MDLIYIKIFEPYVVYCLLGSVVVLAVIGSLVYVGTKFCSRKCAMWTTRHLLTVPEHICFHDSMTYPGQTRRILRATWSIFWFIMCSAYVAFLATTFTIKPPEVAINTFKRLSETKAYKIASTAVGTAFLDILLTSNNKTMLEIREKLIEQNKTDNSTFDTDFERQTNRVIQGHYALLSGFCITIGACDKYLINYLPEIRAYQFNTDFISDESYVATPKQICYDRELYRAMLTFEEMGILQQLRGTHLNPGLLKQIQINKINNATKGVTISRILLAVYMSVAGVTASAVCLGSEIMYNRWKERCACRSV